MLALAGHDQAMSAASPNPAMIDAEALFTHFSAFWSNLSRNAPTQLLNIIHHESEPMKTPPTKAHADVLFTAAFINSMLAKNAPKERIVIGFMSVRNNVWA